jgi:hypothetical protein
VICAEVDGMLNVSVVTHAMGKKLRFMFRRFWVLPVLVSLVACAHQNRVAVSSTEVRNITNSDIRWDGNFLGLHPNFSGASKKIIENRTVNFDELVSALADERRYVAAHAILTTVSGHLIEPQPGGIDPLTGKILPGTEKAIGKFNGLRVDLLADGTVVIPDNQQSKIADAWRLWLKSSKKKADNL